LNSLLYDVAIPYTVQDVAGPRGFKYELVYQGFERGVIKITYREYANDIARPAFQQDLSYTLEKGTTAVSFRNIKMEIYGADNNGIRYRVLTPFKAT
jgi:hypothetical protein